MSLNKGLLYVFTVTSILLLLLGLNVLPSSYAQLDEEGIVRGKVFDFKTFQPIRGVKVTVKELGLTVTTDSSGNFNLSLPKGSYTLEFSKGFFGIYENKIVKVILNTNEVINLTVYLEYSFLVEFAMNYGYLGVFVTSMLGNVLPFIPVPYLLLVLTLSLFTALDPLVLGIVAGIGGTLGKVTSYLIGRVGRKFVGQESRRRLVIIGRFTERYGIVAIFIFGLTPLPDDLIVIPAGLMNYNFLKFFISFTAGRIVLATSTAYGTKIYGQSLEESLGEEGASIAILASVIVVILFTFMLLTVKWERITIIAASKGWLRSLPMLVLDIVMFGRASKKATVNASRQFLSKMEERISRAKELINKSSLSKDVKERLSKELEEANLMLINMDDKLKVENYFDVQECMYVVEKKVVKVGEELGVKI